jgi:hypothetical protein
MPPLRNLTGEKFHKLRVLIRAPNNPVNGRVRWKCRCDCGNVVAIESKKIVSGHTRSCGCLLHDMLVERNSRHGLSRTPFYGIWKNMVYRGNSGSESGMVGKYYTSKSVGLCDRWREFKKFREDMYRSYLIHCIEYGRDNTSIDRIDNNGDYSPENCRWTTWKEQNRNTRRQRLFVGKRSRDKYIDIGDCKVEFAEEYGLSRKGLCNCLRGEQKTHKGWTFQYIE